MSDRKQKILPREIPSQKGDGKAPFLQDNISIPQASGIVGIRGKRRLAPKPDATKNPDKLPRIESEFPPVKRQRVPLLQDSPDLLHQAVGMGQTMHIMSDIGSYMSYNIPEGIPDIGIGKRFPSTMANIIQPTIPLTTPSLFDPSTTTSFQYPSHENNIQTSNPIYPPTFQSSPSRPPFFYPPTPEVQICASCDVRLRHLRQGIMQIPDDALKLKMVEIYLELRDNWHDCSKRGLEVGGL